jgi:predicted ABC-type ATPase
VSSTPEDRSGHPPAIVALTGPNGAGKSTVGPPLLKETLGVTKFVNADVIAQGLSAFDPDSVAFEAGRIMLQRLKELATRGESFAFETTLAARIYSTWIPELLDDGYRFHLFYLWLPSADLAIARVKDRVRVGGHDIPDATVRRRYSRGLSNFFELYRPLATSWRVYDNSGPCKPELVAAGRGEETNRVVVPDPWQRISRSASDERK